MSSPYHGFLCTVICPVSSTAAAAAGTLASGTVSRVPSLLDYASTLARPASSPPVADLNALFPPVTDPWGGDDDEALAAAGQPNAVREICRGFLLIP